MGKNSVVLSKVEKELVVERQMEAGFAPPLRCKTFELTKSFSADVSKQFEGILDALCRHFGLDRKDPNFKDTPQRVGRAYEEIFSGLRNSSIEVTSILARTFPGTSQEMLVCGPVHVWSMCPHHFLPVEMNVWVAYIPKKKLLGLSKLARLAQVLAARPLMQEQVTADIVDALYKSKDLRPAGAACHVAGRHLCMAMRGVKQDARFRSTALRGIFTRPSAKAEFLEACI